MEKCISMGFSLLEVLIATVLLGLLSLSLVQSALNMRVMTDSMASQIDEFWQRQSVVSVNDAGPPNQVNALAKKSTTHFAFADSNNDGHDDSWIQLNALPKDMRFSLTKTQTVYKWKSGRIDTMSTYSKQNSRTP